MSYTIGDRTVELDTTERDETVYVGSTHTVSNIDTVSLRRTRASNKPLRTALRFERSFASTVSGEANPSVTVSLAFTVPANLDTAAAATFVNDTLTQAATMAGHLAITGDIHL